MAVITTQINPYMGYIVTHMLSTSEGYFYSKVEYDKYFSSETNYRKDYVDIIDHRAVLLTERCTCECFSPIHSGYALFGNPQFVCSNCHLRAPDEEQELINKMGVGAWKDKFKPFSFILDSEEYPPEGV